MMTLSNPGGMHFTPVSAPVVFKRIVDKVPQLGFIEPRWLPPDNGKVIAGAPRMLGVEGEGRGQHQETLRMRISLEGRAERLAYRGTTAVRADQVRSIDLARAPDILDDRLDPVIELPQRRDAGGKIHARMGRWRRRSIAMSASLCCSHCTT
jgi:hypothetical protein